MTSVRCTFYSQQFPRGKTMPENNYIKDQVSDNRFRKSFTFSLMSHTSLIQLTCQLGIVIDQLIARNKNAKIESV